MEIEPFSFDRRFVLPVSRERLWEVLQRTAEYPDWWSWLRRFDLDGEGGDRGGGGAGLAPGTVAHCVVRGPLPYELRFSVHVEEVVEAERVVTRVSGALEGPARLELTDSGVGCEAWLAWEVHVRDPALRAAARVGRPVMVWGHDLVVDRGVRQFRRHALI